MHFRVPYIPPHRPTAPPAHRPTGPPGHRATAPRPRAAPRPRGPFAPLPMLYPLYHPTPPPPQVPVRYLIYQGRILVRYGCTIVPYKVSGMQTPPGPIASGPPQGLTATGTTRFRRTLRYSRLVQVPRGRALPYSLGSGLPGFAALLHSRLPGFEASRASLPCRQGNTRPAKGRAIRSPPRRPRGCPRKESDMERESLVFMAKLAEQAERFDEMVKYMKQVATAPQELSVEERNLLSVSASCCVRHAFPGPAHRRHTA